MNSTSILLTLLCTLLSIFTSTLHSQTIATWQQPHTQLNPTYFATENSQPNPTHFGNMIGTAGGKEIGNYFNPQFDAAGVINSFRSFHLMEADFGDAYFPKEKELSTIECDCGDVLYSCEEDKKCVDEYLPYNTYGFRGYKAHYCDWTNDKRFGIKEIYAALESLTPIKPTYCNTTVEGECVEEYINPCLPQDGRETIGSRKFPDKWYTADEWGGQVDSIQKHARNYVYNFAATFCPTDYQKDCVVQVLELGNEPWGLETPGRLGYHAILKGAVQALKEYYGLDKNQWRMKLSTAAFDARFACDNAPMQYIHEMIPNDPEVKKYIDYLNVHNYPFTNNPCGVPVSDLKLDHIPESPDGGFLSLKNMEVWKQQNGMEHARINMTEFGWNSNQEDCNSGVGQANQAAYHMRAYLLAARFGIHKGFSYCLKDQPKYVWNGNEYSPESPLYCSTGLIDRAGNKKAAFHATETFVKRLGQKHFIKAVEEKFDRENGIFAYLLGEVDETGLAIPTHLVAWRASDLGVSDNETIQYPKRDTELGRDLTTLTLPSTDMDFSYENKYFYLGWDETAPRIIGDNIVNQNGLEKHQINVDLSGLPIVIPINPADCGYDENGALFGGDLAVVNSANELEGSVYDDNENATIYPASIVDFTCGDITITYGEGQIKMEGKEGVNYSKFEVIDITNNQYKTVFTCSGNNCGSMQVVDNLSAGNYLVKVFNSDWSYNCEIAYGTPIQLKHHTVISVPCDGLGGDSDGDGICDEADCSPFNASLPQPVGTPCDDGNNRTFNDKIQDDGCGCTGTLGQQVSCGDVTITYGNDQIIMEGAPDKKYMFSVQNMSKGWKEVFSCWNNCETTQIVTDLPISKYSVKVYGPEGTCAQYIRLEGNPTDAQSRGQLALSAHLKNGKVQLEWMVEQTTATDNFILEKSEDGIHFERIETRANSANNYFFKSTDHQPFYGDNYYRVKEEFTDGTHRYSAISKEIYHLNDEDLTLFPNPVQSNLWVNIDTAVKGNITIFNALGNPIINHELAEGERRLNFDVTTFDNGIYYLVLMQSGKRLLTRRFVIEGWH